MLDNITEGFTVYKYEVEIDQQTSDWCSKNKQKPKKPKFPDDHTS